MKLTLTFFLSIILSLCNGQDSIVFNLGGSFVTIYKDGHSKRIPSLGSNTNGKYLTNNGTSFQWQTIAGGGDMLKTDNLSGLSNYTTARSNLGLIIGTNVLAPNGSASSLTSFPTLNQNTTGSAAILTTPRNINGVAFDGSANITAYTFSVNVQALTSSPADGATIFIGQLPKAPVTTSGQGGKIFVRQSCTIRIAEIYTYSGTSGTNEAWVFSIRKNNTTDTQIASVSLATNERIFSNTGLSISMSAGDYFEVKAVNPTWGTNPLTTIIGGYVMISIP